MKKPERGGGVDLIVDDGLHTFEAGTTLFTHAFEFLSREGTYVIEDVHVADLPRYKQFFLEHSEIEVLFWEGRRRQGNFADNRLILIRRALLTDLLFDVG